MNILEIIADFCLWISTCRRKETNHHLQDWEQITHVPEIPSFERIWARVWPSIGSLKKDGIFVGEPKNWKIEIASCRWIICCNYSKHPCVSRRSSSSVVLESCNRHYLKCLTEAKSVYHHNAHCRYSWYPQKNNKCRYMISKAKRVLGSAKILDARWTRPIHAMVGHFCCKSLILPWSDLLYRCRFSLWN